MKRTMNITKSLLGVMVIAALVFVASCGNKEETVTPPSGITYQNPEVEVGEEKTVAPAGDVTGTPTYSIDDDGGADFLTINSQTGELTVGKESTTGSYTVKIKITNSAGSANVSLVVKVNVPTAFNPVGKKLLPMYFINQTSNLQLIGLTGIPDLPFDTLDVPVGWPPAGIADPDSLMPYLLFGELTKIIWQVPSDNVCSVAGDTTLVEIKDDFTLTTVCSDGTPDSKTGDWTISFKDGSGYVLTLTFIFDADNNIVIPYAIGQAEFITFTDPFLSQDYPALHGTVDAFTTPTDFTDEGTLTNPLTWQTPTIEVVMMVLNP